MVRKITAGLAAVTLVWVPGAGAEVTTTYQTSQDSTNPYGSINQIQYEQQVNTLQSWQTFQQQIAANMTAAQAAALNTPVPQPVPAPITPPVMPMPPPAVIATPPPVPMSGFDPMTQQAAANMAAAQAAGLNPPAPQPVLMPVPPPVVPATPPVMPMPPPASMVPPPAVIATPPPVPMSGFDPMTQQAAANMAAAQAAGLNPPAPQPVLMPVPPPVVPATPPGMPTPPPAPVVPPVAPMVPPPAPVVPPLSPQPVPAPVATSEQWGLLDWILPLVIAMNAPVTPPPVGVGPDPILTVNPGIIDRLEEIRNGLYREELRLQNQVAGLANSGVATPEMIDRAIIEFNLTALMRIDAEIRLNEARYINQQGQAIHPLALVEFPNANIGRMQDYLSRHRSLLLQQTVRLGNLREAITGFRGRLREGDPRRRFAEHAIELIVSEVELTQLLVGTPSTPTMAGPPSGGVANAVGQEAALQAIFAYNQRLVQFHVEKDEPFWRANGSSTRFEQARREQARVSEVARNIQMNNRPVLMRRPLDVFRIRFSELFARFSMP